MLSQKKGAEAKLKDAQDLIKDNHSAHMGRKVKLDEAEKNLKEFESMMAKYRELKTMVENGTEVWGVLLRRVCTF